MRAESQLSCNRARQPHSNLHTHTLLVPPSKSTKTARWRLNKQTNSALNILQNGWKLWTALCVAHFIPQPRRREKKAKRKALSRVFSCSSFGRVPGVSGRLRQLVIAELLARLMCERVVCISARFCIAMCGENRSTFKRCHDEDMIKVPQPR
jgi:hypothetical protein